MSVRNQLTKLRTAVGKAKGDETVQAISKLIDELSAAAAGGGGHREQMGLTDYFEPAQTPPTQERNIK